MEKITIQELYEKVKENFSTVSNLKKLYVGKTKNSESIKQRHNDEYDTTMIIATGSPAVISKGEDYLIRHLKKDFPVANKKEGSAGCTDANMLYIAWDIEYKDIKQLYEPEIFQEPFELINN